MKKEREITVKIIENKKVYDKLLIEFFAKKYCAENLNKQKEELKV